MALTAFCTAISAKIDAVMAGAAHQRRMVNRRARRLERAARHLLAAYQRTYTDDTVWEVEADELHLDCVIALEALLISPNDERGGIANNIRSRASALFLTPDLSVGGSDREDAHHPYLAFGIRLFLIQPLPEHADVAPLPVDRVSELALSQSRELALLRDPHSGVGVLVLRS
ncbi:hypothetical protein [Streptomyces tanashiensis]|uniref:hypothetical protein n=1 Tax=Streptomyces tanashiensis TaxID=67367 RepID=UPI0034447D72